MKRSLLILSIVFYYTIGFAQSESFPKSWIGNWKGDLLWYKTGRPDPQKVNMELRIQPSDSTDTYTWQLIYGSKEEDYRPYILKPIDKENGHWVIDELSGIVLDQFWVGNKFSGGFTVQTSTIINSYSIENGKLIVEFYGMEARPFATSGKGTNEVPNVDSYKLGSYQKAVLIRTN